MDFRPFQLVRGYDLFLLHPVCEVSQLLLKCKYQVNTYKRKRSTKFQLPLPLA